MAAGLVASDGRGLCDRYTSRLIRLGRDHLISLHNETWQADRFCAILSGFLLLLML
jgi:hypothetical protein